MMQARTLRTTLNADSNVSVYFTPVVFCPLTWVFRPCWTRRGEGAEEAATATAPCLFFCSGVAMCLGFLSRKVLCVRKYV
jgi:hypothetical protein